MSRKKKAPKKIQIVDPIYKSSIIPKLVNSIMYDGKKVIAEKIIYDAIDKIKSKVKEEPINVFNEAINNIKPTVEVRSRRVGGATYQVPVEVKSKRSQALALRWLIDAPRKRKDKNMSDKIFNEAINNIKPTVEVRSRRVGGATYQVPVEVKSKRAQALAIRWLVESARKRKDKHMADKIFNELYDAYEKKGAAVKKREDVHKMAESNKAFAHFRW